MSPDSILFDTIGLHTYNFKHFSHSVLNAIWTSFFSEVKVLNCVYDARHDPHKQTQDIIALPTGKFKLAAAFIYKINYQCQLVWIQILSDVL